MENFVAKLVNLPRKWFIPFSQDFAFYAIFSLIFSSAVRHFDSLVLTKGCNVAATRILWISIISFCWAWFLILSYTGLQASDLAKKFHVLYGLEEKMRQTYNLPKLQWRENKSFHDCKWNILRNQIVYFGLGGAFFYCFSHDSWEAQPSSMPEVILTIALYMVIFDILIYTGHRILHKYFYRYHRDHHSTKGTMPCSGWYMHIIDLFVELLIPVFFAPLIFQGNWLIVWTWLALMEWDGVHTHSGFDFLPGIIPSSTRHWLHHMLFSCNYSPGLGDYLFDTEAREKRKRNKTPQPQPTSIKDTLPKSDTGDKVPHSLCRNEE